jgi:hypothetical protein
MSRRKMSGAQVIVRNSAMDTQSTVTASEDKAKPNQVNAASISALQKIAGRMDATASPSSWAVRGSAGLDAVLMAPDLGTALVVSMG